jgi:hypothetical protein
MPGLVPGIHAFAKLPSPKTWMAGTSPAMTSADAGAPLAASLHSLQSRRIGAGKIF